MNIIKYRKLFLTIGLGIVLVSLGILLTLGLKPGIDFTGGSLTEVRYASVPEKAQVEAAIEGLSLGEYSVRQSDSNGGSGYLITTRDLNETERAGLEAALTSLGSEGTIARFTSVGPVIGQELFDKALWAIGAMLIVIICYVAFAFSGVGKPVSSWIYGFLVTLILGHDILVPVAAMAVMGYFMGAQADILFVTALLTILGYSVNDTIVIFDRVREKLTMYRREEKKTIKEAGVSRVETTYHLTRPFDEIVGEAVSDTMARSINTSLTVFLALIALYVFGSEVTENFALVLMIGVIAGSYSSIFIASPLLVFVEERFIRKRAETTVLQ